MAALRIFCEGLVILRTLSVIFGATGERSSSDLANLQDPRLREYGQVVVLASSGALADS